VYLHYYNDNIIVYRNNFLDNYRPAKFVIVTGLLLWIFCRLDSLMHNPTLSLEKMNE